ncbi:MAG: DUF1800 domain-containing protein [Planctomycetes bacterium]|nr:DUF1800 domain-containing protein [Planctomycetota bacterium]
MSIPWNPDNAAHLLRRAGFGARPDEVAKAVKAGLAATVENLLKPDKSADSLNYKNVNDISTIATWWIRRMASSKKPLAEKLTLFWHNHFATGNHKVDDFKLMHQQNRTIRKNCAGKFRDLMMAMARDPAMIYWLDSQTNVEGSTNKNFARELQELFTTGVLDKNGNHNYTENDVAEAARAFTGWQSDGSKFFFNADDHDFGAKTFKGQTGAFDGGDIIHFLVVEDATARRLCKKLFSFFAYDVALGDPAIDALSNIYLTNDTDIRPVLAAMFQMDEFYSQAAVRTHVLGPAEYLAASVRLVGGTVNLKDPYSLGIWCQDLGQSLLDPPSVFGWKEGLAWLSTTGVLGRIRVGEAIADGRQGDIVVFNPKKALGTKYNKLDAAGATDRILAALDMSGVAAATRAEIINYMQSDDNGAPAPFALDKDTIDKKVRGAVAIVLASPEYQLS